MSRSMLLVLFCGLCASCWVRNPDSCDAQHRCASATKPFCDLAQHQCIATIPDGGLGDGPAQCLTTADCPPTQPTCTNNVCGACTADADCQAHGASAPRCDVANGTCVACLPENGMQAADCTGATAPVCGTDGVCRACQSHAECTSQACSIDGSCAASASVAYVDNKNGACTGTHAGTLADPYCDIQTAVMTGGKPIIRVFGSTTAYGKVTIASGTFTILGPITGTSAKVTGDLSDPAISISGGTTKVVLDSLEITAGGSGQAGIACSNGSVGPNLTAQRLNIHDLAGAGVSANNCTVTLDRDAVGPGNSGGGIALTDSQYAVTNCFIFGNVSNNPGAYFGQNSAPAVGPGFSHNTVAANGGMSGPGGVPGGIVCSAGAANPIAIKNSIIWGNSTMGSGNSATQLSGNCALENVDYNDGTTPVVNGNRNLAPEFVDAAGPTYDFHLTGRTAPNLACCIDQIPGPDPVDHDFDGRARPQPANGLWDIGAHEVP